ncbi:MAG: protein tyrosine phosphatase [Anaerocolumna sp.]|nr:protein tyrosine phosphatase [Anaerocolumna sp.]
MSVWVIFAVRQWQNRFLVASAATSGEEVGNGVHRGTRNKLKEVGIDTSQKRAVQLKREDYNRYDYILGMEQSNLASMERIFGGDKEGKVMRLLKLSDKPRDIADPWYTGDFNKTYEDVYEGCELLLAYLCKENKI